MNIRSGKVAKVGKLHFADFLVRFFGMSVVLGNIMYEIMGKGFLRSY